jgi:hypothetical protein
MAKVQIRNVKSVLKAIETAFTEGIRKSDLYDQIGRFSVERIQQETRKGRDLSKEGAPIKDTSDATKNIKQLIEQGVIKMNPAKPLFFRSGKSQVTQTGQLVDSLKADIEFRKGEITVAPEGSREPATYTWSKSGKPVDFLSDDQVQSNQALAKDLADRGFTFLGMDKKGIKRIRRLVLDEIRRLIRRRR